MVFLAAPGDVARAEAAQSPLVEITHNWDPEDYEGGELVITTTFGQQKVKLKAGDAVLYPSSSTHQVAEVTSGERIVAVTWLQSTVPDPAKREILYNLSQARETMIETVPESAELEQVSNSYVNLLRMWSDI